MEVLLTARARRNLGGIASHIAKDNPGRAESFVLELKERCLSLADFPHRAPLAPEYGQDIRRATHGNYNILHTIIASRRQIIILTIRYGARQPQRLANPCKDDPAS